MKYKAFLYFELKQTRQNLPGKLQALPLFHRAGTAYGSPSCR